MVALDRIHPDDDNPNAMTAEMQAALTDEIQTYGFHGALQVNLCKCEAIDGEHYKLTKGEHRWNSLRELRATEVPCEIVPLKELDDKTELINDNRIRGELIPEKLARLVVKMSNQTTAEDLQRRLHMDPDTLKKTIDPKLAAAPSKDEAEAKKRAAKKTPQGRFNVAMETFEREKVEEKLQKIRVKEKCSEGYAVYLAVITYKV